MLRCNIICEKGLVNGARGIIVGFSWPNGADDQAKKGDLQHKVYVKFQDSRVGLVSCVTIDDASEQETVPIEPVTAKFYGKQGVTLQRTQLPLLPCWAATIHKVQGLSLDAAVIDLCPKMFEDGMVYVALSRVRTLQGVALLGLVQKKSHHEQ
uniref:ATP-dependent DNA helicase n=1 Tax=Amphimedon queenslandica TaxID=400682 RepID=A0A1X7V982_AMPQE